MNYTEQQKQAMAQNLRDAGCDEAVIERFLALKAEGRCKEAMVLLSHQRCKLVCRIHEAEKPLSCLDYFICQMKKEKNEGTGR